MEILMWIIIGLAALICVAAVVFFLVKFFKMTPEERKELIVQYLTGLVIAAEAMWEESGKGSEKMAWVEEQFKARAPWLLKIFLKLTNCGSLTELIDVALDKAKSIVFDKNRV